MNVLLISGMGPEVPNKKLLEGSSFEALLAPAGHRAAAGRREVFDLSLLRTADATRRPLLRPRRTGGRARAVSSVRLSAPVEEEHEPETAPHLTTFTLQSILLAAGFDHEVFPIERIWTGSAVEPPADVDVVLLSTTFIWDRRTLAKAVTWVEERCPTAVLVLGGQYSNLKFQRILSDHPFVRYIVRGDAEAALPALLRALRTKGDVAEIPNLVWRDRDTDRLRMTRIEYIDLDAQPSPSPVGTLPVVPYESMRGCPFSCKYCSFPAASPKWRYKSAQKIADDFLRYRRENGAEYIKALDSTFTVPPTRLRALLPLLAEADVGWEAYTRANSIRDREVVADLERAHCRALSIGLESMNDTTLGYMHKQVKARANRTAFELLSDSSIHSFVSFIVGYPGETPELFEDTRRFLVSEYSGQFALYVFMMNDETMPVWQEADRFGLEVFDLDGEAEDWTHHGMDSRTAARLQLETLREVRWKNDHAIARVWQHGFESPLLPGRSPARNAVVEKLVDRLGMLSADVRDPAEAARRRDRLLSELAGHGVVTAR
ncbi:B12-binding domain-containing radical SAM protein [Streptomyces sp. NPDC059590]|uniref:B12-binding domain-containing radical SAM protein n=1 Tax=Streptomyces sp. NPDC059590 TaxID=3346877 RepID=UPI0036A9D5C3